MKAAGVILAIGLALALQTTLARFVVRGTVPIDLGVVVVVYVALTSGPVAGLLSGTAAGLLQDALSVTGLLSGTASGFSQDVLSGGVIGIGGLAKSIVGFLAGVVGTQFIVARPGPRFVVFLSATLLHAVVFIGLYALLDLRQFVAPYGAVASQAVGNAVVGVVAFQLVELWPGVIERRRAQKARIRR